MSPSIAKLPSPPLLYYITDRRQLQRPSLAEFVIETLRAGVNLVQIREKDLATPKLTSLLDEILRDMPSQERSRILVNDRVDLCLALGLGGVHLPTQSIPPETVRNALPRKFLVGASCHSLEEACAAERARVHYILLGPVFKTPSKIAYGPPLGLNAFAKIIQKVRVPVIALGGINTRNFRQCLEAGAYGIAGISLFQQADSLPALIRELRLGKD